MPSRKAAIGKHATKERKKLLVMQSLCESSKRNLVHEEPNNQLNDTANSITNDNPLESNICLPVNEDEIEDYDITFEADELRKYGRISISNAASDSTAANKIQMKFKDDNTKAAESGNVGNDNPLDFDYRSDEMSSSDEESVDSSDDGLNADKILFEKNSRERYRKNWSTHQTIGDLYEPESGDIISDLAQSMELVCVSTEKNV